MSDPDENIDDMVLNNMVLIVLDEVFEFSWNVFIRTCDEHAWDSRLVDDEETKAEVRRVMRQRWEAPT